MRLVVEPGLHPSSHDGPMEHIGVPYGSVARLILLFLQTEALRTNSVIAHPTLAMCSTGSLVDRTNRKVSSTEAPLTFAVLTTERKAA